MIEDLQISDLGVIAAAQVRPGPGLTVLSGETGAGKTMLLTGLGLLCGGKADSATVRQGASTARVTGRFQWDQVPVAVSERLDEVGGELDEDGSLVVTRTVAAQGRSRSALGGVAVPAPVLRDVIGELVTVHGQNDQVRLRAGAKQRDALDLFAGAEHAENLAEHRRLYTEHRAAEGELEQLAASAHERAREAQLLRLGLAELEQVAPQPGEDVELAALAERLRHREDLRFQIAQVRGTLDPDELGLSAQEAGTAGVVSDMDRVRRSLERAERLDPQAGALARAADDLAARVAELVSDVAAYAASVDDESLSLEAVEERLGALGRLTRAYGPTVDDVLAWAQEAAQRLDNLDSDDERLPFLNDHVAALAAALEASASRLHAGRVAAAEKFAEAVSAELAGLAMPDARLTIDIASTQMGPSGTDDVAFLLSAHRGAPARPIAQSASGGELSRVMLALEVVLAEQSTAQGTDEAAPTMVFDEVDAGIGGSAATDVGRRLARLARTRQVIVITHLAQVAAFAQRHLVVVKQRGADAVASSVTQVDGEDRVRELARMLAGDAESATARAHAAELLAAAQTD